jgi:hypothetical protein
MTGRLIVTTVLVALAALCITSGIYRTSIQVIPYQSASVHAHKARAAQALGNRDYKTSLLESRQAVSETPLDQATLSVFGAASLGMHDAASARKIFSTAALLGWRDPLVERYWINQSLLSAAADPAAQWLDALMRIYGIDDSARAVLPILESTDAGRSALLTRIYKNPSWLDDWIRSSVQLDDDSLDDRIAIVNSARQSGVRLKREAVAIAVTRLFMQQQYNQALALWEAAESAGAIGSSGLWDDDFSRAKDTAPSSPFEWQLLHGASAQLALERNGPGQQLTVSSLSSSAQRVARQGTLIPAGIVRLTWTGHAANGLPLPLYARLQCDSGRTLQALSDGGQGNVHWITVAIPPSGCAAEFVMIWFDPALSPARTATLNSVSLSRDAAQQ